MGEYENYFLERICLVKRNRFTWAYVLAQYNLCYTSITALDEKQNPPSDKVEIKDSDDENLQLSSRHMKNKYRKNAFTSLWKFLCTKCLWDGSILYLLFQCLRFAYLTEILEITHEILRSRASGPWKILYKVKAI